MTALGAMFAASKAFAFWKSDIEPAGGPGPWFENVFLPKMKEKIQNLAESIIESAMGSAIAAAMSYLTDKTAEIIEKDKRGNPYS